MTCVSAAHTSALSAGVHLPAAGSNIIEWSLELEPCRTYLVACPQGCPSFASSTIPRITCWPLHTAQHLHPPSHRMLTASGDWHPGNHKGWQKIPVIARQ